MYSNTTMYTRHKRDCQSNAFRGTFSFTEFQEKDLFDSSKPTVRLIPRTCPDYVPIYEYIIAAHFIGEPTGRCNPTESARTPGSPVDVAGIRSHRPAIRYFLP
jgi:hypothetical protein